MWPSQQSPSLTVTEQFVAISDPVRCSPWVAGNRPGTAPCFGQFGVPADDGDRVQRHGCDD